MNKIIVVIGQQKLPLYIRQSVAKPYMVSFPEWNVVIFFGGMIGRIAVEQRRGTIINLNEIFKILVFDHHRGLHQPNLNVGQIIYCVPEIFYVAAVCFVVSSERYLHAQEIPRGTLNIGQPAHIELSGSVLEKLTRVAVTVKLSLKLRGVLFYAAHKIDKLTVRVVVDLKRRVAVFVEKNPTRSAENLNVAVECSLRGKALTDVLSQ